MESECVSERQEHTPLHVATHLASSPPPPGCPGPTTSSPLLNNPPLPTHPNSHSHSHSPHSNSKKKKKSPSQNSIPIPVRLARRQIAPSLPPSRLAGGNGVAGRVREAGDQDEHAEGGDRQCCVLDGDARPGMYGGAARRVVAWVWFLGQSGACSCGEGC